MTDRLVWFKSSNGEGGACVEVAACPTTVHVRDSKLTDRPELGLPAPAWGAFGGKGTVVGG
ncbi:DUF397 domain-containing protein [Streptomyces sp. NPDC057307]|uniref:DUF397 domain-containing protein n=1 Tax=Streptomyces sp. NPDC057307 TaxID=3346096 RepID=UPI00363CA6FE